MLEDVDNFDIASRNMGILKNMKRQMNRNK